MRFALRLFVFSIVVVSVAAIWSHRVKAKAQDPSEFAPRSVIIRTVPAGTSIQGVLAYGITESTTRGDKVIALVSDPVVLGGETIIPVSAQLEGTIDKIQQNGPSAETVLKFTRVIINGTATDIHTVPVTISAPVISDLQVLGDAFGVSAGALLGTAVGAASNNPRQVPRGAVFGGVAAVSAPVKPPKVRVIVDRDVRVSWS
jgi:hypothetical protein